MRQSIGIMVAAASLIVGGTAGATVVSASTETADVIHFVIDVSGSMGGTKITEAVEAIKVTAAAIDDSTALGLRSYAGSCNQAGVEPLVEIGVNNDAAIIAGADSLRAGGGTPTTAALGEGIADVRAFDTSGTQRIVLLTDGDTQCGISICDFVKSQDLSDLDLSMYAVGLQVGSAAAADLTCAAEFTGGEYIPAANPEDLVKALGAATGGGPPRWVAMGDSFSSGEGAQWFHEGTNVDKGNECRRSDAYASLANAQLAAPVEDFMFVACSGARIRHVTALPQYPYPQSPEGIHGGERQLNYLDGSETIVTLTMGGNDFGFGDILNTCIGSKYHFAWTGITDFSADIPWILEFTKQARGYDWNALANNCESYAHKNLGSFYQAVESHVRSLEDDLTDMYSAISAQSPRADVYVLGYPMFIPGENLPTCNELVGLEGQERIWLRSLIMIANETVERAATAAGVTFVDVEQTFEDLGSADGENHLPCSDDPYHQGVTSGPVHNFYHPKRAGHVEMARVLASCIQDGSTCNPPTPWLYCNGLRATNYGTNSSETIKGLPNRADVIVTLGGDDEVTARDDNHDDTICGGDGNDKLSGGNGNDLVFGGSGDDTLFGDDGNDQLWGGEGNDVLHGKAGDDFLYGEGGDDVLHGGRFGTDFCDGGTGVDEAPGRWGCQTKVGIP